MKKLIVGLCKGRHEMPVEGYIFESITNPSDIKEIEKLAAEWVEEHCDIGIASSAGINQCDYTDVQVYTGSVELVIYVTGLTVALTSVLKVCVLNGVKTTLMHYDCKTDKYVPQKFI